MIAEFIEVDDPRWREALCRTRHDVYHLPEYTSVAARYEGGTPTAFYAVEDDCVFLMPLLIRAVPAALGAPAGWNDATSPYGYSGPIGSPGCDVTRARRFIAAFEALARERDTVAAFLRLNPLSGIPSDAFAPGACVRHSSIVLIDLTRPLARLQAETRKDHRQGIRRLSQAGFTTVIDDWSAFDSFKAAYRSTMDRLSAADFYYFSDAYFDDLRRSLGERLHICSVQAPNGEVACAGLFTSVGGTVQYHLSGTVSAYLRWAPSKLMLDAVRTWASRRGDTVLNLGGAPDAEGSLMLFKGGFSRVRADFRTARMVIHDERYAQLQAAERVRSGWGDDPDGFFPSYRRPSAAGGDRRGPRSADVSTATFITPDDARWAAVLTRARHDVYHLPEYVRASAGLNGGVPVAYYAECGDSALLIPLLIRDLCADIAAPTGWKDAITPYGYGGPIATDGCDPAIIERMVSAFRSVAEDISLVTVFLRLHPLRGVPLQTLESLGTLVRHEPIVYIDLARSREELAAETRSNHRRNIAKLRRSGFVAEMDRWSDYAAFQRAYRMTMERQAASAFYFFSGDYFEDLRNLLGERMHLCTVHSPQGDVVAAGVFTTVDGLVEYHLGGTVDEYLPLAPSKLMFEHVRDWAKDRGDTILNLGGGIGASPGPLLHFKAGFSSARAEFHTCRVTIDAKRSAALERARLQSRALIEDAPNDFFPPYRAP